MSKLPPKFNPKFYDARVRWAVDYPPEYMNKLRETDPAAYEYLLKFLEAEYGGNSKALGLKKKDRKRCDAQVNGMRSDAMNKSIYDIQLDDVIEPQNPEDAIIASIDHQDLQVLKERAKKKRAWIERKEKREKLIRERRRKALASG